MNGEPILIDSQAWSSARPRLSVLTPYFRDDPSNLLAELDVEAEALAGRVELILLDDGTGDVALAERMAKAVQAARLAVRLIQLRSNEGRAKGRNRLSETARGQSLLFLDSDMSPDTPGFLGRWLALAETEDPAVAFGGFSVDRASQAPEYAVHRAMAKRSDCISSEERARAPEKYVFTSNLLVRRDVFDSEAFDNTFSGWGWEDVEWAMRVARKHPIVHLDNPATHLGLESVSALAGKYEQSVANFARVIERHPDFVTQYPSYKVARMLKRVPGLGLWRPMIKRAALTTALPVKARAFSLRLYRAALYAEAV